MEVTPIAGTLEYPFCHESWQTTYEKMMAATRVPLPTNIGSFVASENPPGPNDRDKAWFNTAEVRWYWPDTDTGKWISPHPIPALSRKLEMWDDTTANLILYDGGTSYPITRTAC